MKKKLNIVLLGMLVVSLMISTASAASVNEHAAGTGMMAHPTSSSGISGCSTCHGILGSATSTGFCTNCHGFPTFTLRVSANPTGVTTGTAAPVQFIVKNGPANGPNVTGASVSLSGAGVSTGTSGTTVLSGLTTISVNAASAGIITATASKTASYTNGTTTLTASKPAPVLTSIAVTPAAPTITQGQDQQFVATGTYSDSTTAVITNSVTWSSSNNSVATIGATGLAASVSAGTAQITATSGAVSGTAKITVTAAQTTGSASVTFVVTDKVTGKPVHDAKVSMDGVTKETNDNGIVIFNKVSLRAHYYTVYEEHHSKLKGSIKVTGNMQVPVKLVPLVHKEKRLVHQN